LMHKPKLQPLEQIGFLPLNIWPWRLWRTQVAKEKNDQSI
jgi:hypothetical protein